MPVISFVVIRAASHEQNSVPLSDWARGWWGGGNGNALHSYVELRKRAPWRSLVSLHVTNGIPRTPSSNGTLDGSIARLVLVVNLFTNFR
jgi:hypothetical protein